jgi:hypothetical protein
LARPLQQWIYGAKIAKTQIKDAPIFIIGHWRSGTTLLHELMVLDERYTEVDDIVQEVFLVVRRRLRDFDGRNVAGWLYRIASRKVGQHRRRRWISTLFSPRQAVDINDLPSGRPSAMAEIEKQLRRIRFN